MENKTSVASVLETSAKDSGDGRHSKVNIPNILEALVTLVVCGLLLAGSLLIIKKARIWCNRHGRGKLENEDEEMQAMNAGRDYQWSGGPIPIFITACPGTPRSLGESQPSNGNVSKGEQDIAPSPSSPGASGTEQGSNEVATCADSSPSGKKISPKVTFARRASGPFGDDVLEFMEETYHKSKTGKKNYEDKESSWTRRASLKNKVSRTPSPLQPSLQSMAEVSANLEKSKAEE